MHPPEKLSGSLDVVRLERLDDFSARLFEASSASDLCTVLLDFLVPGCAPWASITLHEAGIKSRRGIERGPSRPIPLTVRGQTFGLLTLGRANEATAADFLLVERAAHRCALAFYNVLIYERERRVSLAFQSAAAAVALPDLGHFSLSVLYEAGRGDSLVGGDWYDAFMLLDGRIVLSIGDVTGSGLEAAVGMAMIRNTIRSVAYVHPEPTLMFAAADRAVRERYTDRFATAFVGIIDPVTSMLTYSNAGHPPPLVRSAEGKVTPLTGTGVPLGMPDFNRYVRVLHAKIEPHSALVLYTDGLTEATRDVIQGEARLIDAVGDLSFEDETDPARALYRQLLPAHGRDDVAIMTVYARTVAPMRRWRFNPDWSDVTRRVHREIREQLADAGVGGADMFAVQMILLEITANVVRHAPGTAEFLLESSGERKVLHVLDKGSGFTFAPRLPRDLFSEAGRGLFLISHLAEEFNVDKRPGGGSHARIAFKLTKGKV